MTKHVVIPMQRFEATLSEASAAVARKPKQRRNPNKNALRELKATEGARQVRKKLKAIRRQMDTPSIDQALAAHKLAGKL